MGFLRNLKLRFRPPRITDPDFGSLDFVFIPNAPALGTPGYLFGTRILLRLDRLVPLGLPFRCLLRFVPRLV